LKTGAIIKTFTAKDGRDVTLRTPKWEDLDDLMELINSLVEENVDIHRIEKVTREQEIDFMGSFLGRIEKRQIFYLLAELDGKVVANSELRIRTGRSRHVGDIGIAIKNGCRDIGIGSEMLKCLFSQAEEMGLKMLTLTVFSTNKRAIHVYEKVGFRETGRIPNDIYKNEEFVDEIIMVKELTQN
jgi:ribosomal protein S18 acetylase RimI-like enzyme